MSKCGSDQLEVVIALLVARAYTIGVLNVSSWPPVCNR
jgi:hypothetical protein